MFDKEFILEELSSMGNPLPRLKEILDFEQFRPIFGTGVRQGKPEEQCRPQALRPGAHDAGALPSADLWAQRQADRMPGQGQDEFA